MSDIIKRIADLIGEGGTLAPDSMSGQLLNECANEIGRLERENATLAAGACLCVKGDEHGNAYCEMKRQPVPTKEPAP